MFEYAQTILEHIFIEIYTHIQLIHKVVQQKLTQPLESNYAPTK